MLGGALPLRSIVCLQVSFKNLKPISIQTYFDLEVAGRSLGVRLDLDALMTGK